jgi:hypothetical protein
MDIKRVSMSNNHNIFMIPHIDNVMKKADLIGLDDHMTVELKRPISLRPGRIKTIFPPSGDSLFFPQELSFIEGKPPSTKS